MEAAGEQVSGAAHFGTIEQGGNRFARVPRHFELNGPIGLALYDRDALANAITDDKIGDPQSDEVTSTKLAVDGEVEERQVAEVACKFEPRSNGPDLFGQKRAFLSERSMNPTLWRQGRMCESGGRAI